MNKQKAKRKRTSIQKRTFFFVAILMSAILLISFMVLYLSLPKFYYLSKKNILQENSNLLIEQIEATDNESEIYQLLENFSTENNASIEATNLEGDFLVYSALYNALSQDVSLVVTRDSTEENIVHDGSISTDENFMYINQSLDIGSIKHLKIAVPLQPINEAQKVILAFYPLLFIFSLFAIFIGAYFYADQYTKPIIQLSDTAKKMQKLCPVPYDSKMKEPKDELEQLANTLEIQSKSLENTLKNLRLEIEKVSYLEHAKTDFMRAASHELKTPLAGLQGIIEGMLDSIGKYKNRDEYLEVCLEIIHQTDAIIQSILQTSSLSDHQLFVQKQKISVDKILEDEISKSNMLIEEKNIKIDLKIKQTKIETNKFLFQQVISNLISNAIYYTPQSGNIYCSLDQNGMLLQNNCVIEKNSDIQKLCEPFYVLQSDANQARSGTGLGLYIVKCNLEKLKIVFEIKIAHNVFSVFIFFKNKE